MTTKEIIRDFNKRPLMWCEKLPHETKIVYLHGEENCLLTGNTTQILFFCLATIRQILGEGGPFIDYLKKIITEESKLKEESTSNTVEKGE